MVHHNRTQLAKSSVERQGKAKRVSGKSSPKPGIPAFSVYDKGKPFHVHGPLHCKICISNPIRSGIGWESHYFVGDRHARQEPLAVILPQKAWTWATHKMYSKANEMVTFYADDRNYGKYFVSILWAQRKWELTCLLCCLSH